MSLEPGELGAILVWARALPLSLLLAVLQKGLVPIPVALSVSLALGAGLASGITVVAPPGSGLSWLAVRVVREAVLGAAFALAVAVPVAALRLGVRSAEWSGSLARRGDWASLYVLLALVLTVQLGGDQALLRGVSVSLSEASVGPAGLDAAALFARALRVASDAFGLALAFALPLFVALALLDAATALVQRALWPSGAQVAEGSMRAVLALLLFALMLASLAARVPSALPSAIQTARAWVRAAAA